MFVWSTDWSWFDSHFGGSLVKYGFKQEKLPSFGQYLATKCIGVFSDMFCLVWGHPPKMTNQKSFEKNWGLRSFWNEKESEPWYQWYQKLVVHPIFRTGSTFLGGSQLSQELMRNRLWKPPWFRHDMFGFHSDVSTVMFFVWRNLIQKLSLPDLGKKISTGITNWDAVAVDHRRWWSCHFPGGVTFQMTW